MRRAIVGVVVLCGFVGVLAAANLNRDPGAVDVDWRVVQAPPHEVVLESLARGPIVQTVTAPGAVEMIDEADIASQLIGRVVAVNVRDGDRVKRGDVLVKLDETDARAHLDSTLARIAKSKASISQAEADLEKAARDTNRSRQLAERMASTATELADARSAQARAQATLLMNRNELADALAMERMSRMELDRTEIRAPIDGVVSGLEVEVGEVVIAGTTNLPGTVLMTVGDPTRLRVRADVDESDVRLTRPDQPAKVYLQADLTRPISGKVERVAAKGKKTEEVVSFETFVLVDPDPAVRAGMTSTVEIEVQRAESALGVPVQAVVHRRRKDLPDTPAVRAWAERHARTPGEKAKEAESRYVKIVFVAVGNVARAMPVETGLSDERRVEILSGLKPDDRLIVGPFRALDELKDGDPIIPAKTALGIDEKRP